MNNVCAASRLIAEEVSPMWGGRGAVRRLANSSRHRYLNKFDPGSLAYSSLVLPLTTPTFKEMTENRECMMGINIWYRHDINFWPILWIWLSCQAFLRSWPIILKSKITLNIDQAQIQFLVDIRFGSTNGASTVRSWRTNTNEGFESTQSRENSFLRDVEKSTASVEASAQLRSQKCLPKKGTLNLTSEFHFFNNAHYIWLSKIAIIISGQTLMSRRYGCRCGSFSLHCWG